MDIKKKKSLFGLFNFVPNKKEPEVKIKKRPPLKPKKIFINTEGRMVKCSINEFNKAVCEDGGNFSGVMITSGANGEKIEIKYQDGHKIEENLGNNQIKKYTETGTKLSDQYNETISEINIDKSLLNENCKSMVYQDAEIKFARIDFTSGDEPDFTGLEIRKDGIVSGISRTGEQWHIYFAKSGQDIEHDKTDDYGLYKQVKAIIHESKQNSLLSENNPIDIVEEQIDEIYKKISK